MEGGEGNKEWALKRHTYRPFALPMFQFHYCMQVSEDGGHRLGAGVLGKHQTGVARAIWEAVKHTKTPAEEQRY